MVYRTRTYIAADWEHDKDVVDYLRKLNDSDYFRLEFTDAHEMKQARDSSYPCSIKRSLADRFKGSKTFVLIVSDNTDSRRSGACYYCSNYDSRYSVCKSGNWTDSRSYIQYECQKAVNDGLKIVVIYKSTRREWHNCPDIVRNVGKHVPAYFIGRDGKVYWNTQEITDAINS